jgi:hypothetical protein
MTEVLLSSRSQHDYYDESLSIHRDDYEERYLKKCRRMNDRMNDQKRRLFDDEPM